MTVIVDQTPSALDAETVDVVVIGMGPVGKMAALLLGRAGHSVLVTERKEKSYPLPQAVAHDAEIVRVPQNAGLPPDSMPDAVEPYDDLYVWVNSEDQTLHMVDWTGIDPSGWNNTYFYHQPALEARLDEKVHELAAVRAVRNTLHSLGIPVTTFGKPDPSGVRSFSDANATYAAWFDSLNAAAVLVRPDFSVYGTAGDAAEVTDLVRRFLQQVQHGLAPVDDTAVLAAAEPATSEPGTSESRTRSRSLTASRRTA